MPNRVCIYSIILSFNTRRSTRRTIACVLAFSFETTDIRDRYLISSRTAIRSDSLLFQVYRSSVFIRESNKWPVLIECGVMKIRYSNFTDLAARGRKRRETVLYSAGKKARKSSEARRRAALLVINTSFLRQFRALLSTRDAGAKHRAFASLNMFP